MGLVGAVKNYKGYFSKQKVKTATYHRLGNEDEDLPSFGKEDDGITLPRESMLLTTNDGSKYIFTQVKKYRGTCNPVTKIRFPDGLELNPVEAICTWFNVWEKERPKKSRNRVIVKLINMKNKAKRVLKEEWKIGKDWLDNWNPFGMFGTTNCGRRRLLKRIARQVESHWQKDS